jgi:hypothetical protein
MNVIHVPPPIVFVAQAMLPESPLPNATLPFVFQGWIDVAFVYHGAEVTFNDAPPGGEILVIFR